MVPPSEFESLLEFTFEARARALLMKVSNSSLISGLISGARNCLVSILRAFILSPFLIRWLARPKLARKTPLI